MSRDNYKFLKICKIGKRKMTAKNISIREIAKLSGVSISTVSRVINNSGSYSQKTGKKVMDVVKRYDYHANSIARGLRKRKTNSIGIIVPNLGNSFFSNLVELIESQLSNKNFSTIICDTSNSQEKERKSIDMLNARFVDGIIVISGRTKFKMKSLHYSVPLVYIDRESQATDEHYFIGSDHYKGAFLATNKLISAHTKPFLFKNEIEYPSIKDRTRGYIDSFKKSFDTFDPERIFVIPKKLNLQKERAVIRSRLRGIFVKYPSPIGIFATNDSLAVNIILSARDVNINVPKDLKVIGFDDSPVAQYSIPELTTVRQDVETIAKIACSKLIDQIINPNVEKKPQKIIVDVSLVERGSV